MSNRTVLIVLLISLSLRCFCQGHVNYAYLLSTAFKDKEGNKCGSGDLQRFSGMVTVPLSMKFAENKRPISWSMIVSASYGIMNDEGEARALNPDRILNAGFTVSHLRPLSERWNLLASLGCGIYAVPDEVQWQSLLASGAFIFAYHLRENFSVGIGGGLTNSYGIPIIMPMCYLNWKSDGRYEVSVDMANALKVLIATQVCMSLRLELTAVEMDGMAAVMRLDGKHKIYSSTTICSGLNVSFRLFGKTSIYAGIGGVWLRSSCMTDRNLKSFFKSLGDENNKDEYRFNPSLRFSVGFRYGF